MGFDTSYSQTVTSGYEYYASFAQVICMGPVDKLHAIYASGEKIWEGPVDVSEADEGGRAYLTTKLGPVHFYFGTATQTAPEQAMSLLKIDYGSGAEQATALTLPGVCYAIMSHLHFGSQTTPPVMVFEVERNPEHLALTAHSVSDDGLVPEIVYDLLTNEVYGCGIPADDIDSTSFIAACETTLADGVGLGVLADESTDARTLIGQLLAYVDGYLYVEAGKIKIGLVRGLSAGELAALPVLNESDLIEEPEPSNTGLSDTWGRTLVTFTDRDNGWEDSAEAFEDMTSYETLGRRVDKVFSFPYVRQREIAKRLAAQIGSRSAVPDVLWNLTLSPGRRTLHVGDHFKLTYAKLGITAKVLRVTEIRHGSHEDPAVNLVAIEVNAADLGNLYVPSSDQDYVPPVVDDDGTDAFPFTSLTPRCMILPSDLRDGKADGFLLVAGQEAKNNLGYTPHLAIESPYTTYTAMAKQTKFPVAGEVVWWRIVTGSTVLVRVLFSEDDSDRFGDMVDSGYEVYCVTGRRTASEAGDPSDVHELLGMWGQRRRGARCEQISATVWEVTVDFAKYSTTAPAYETFSATGDFPTEAIYFGRKSAFVIHADDDLQFERAAGNGDNDPDWIRNIKAQVYAKGSTQALEDAPIAAYRAKDTTMNASGTYLPDWGLRAPPYSEAVDRALGASFYADIDDPALVEIDSAIGGLWLDLEPDSDFEDIANETNRILGTKTVDDLTPYCHHEII